MTTTDRTRDTLRPDKDGGGELGVSGSLDELSVLPHPDGRMPGFPEWSPAGVALERRLINAISEGFNRSGFRMLDTSAIQPWEVLTAGDGQYSDGGISKPIFGVSEPPETATGARLGLRYDLTVPLARYIAERSSELDFPMHCFQINKVWRAESPDLSHFREFYQCDVDVIGQGQLNLLYDAEIACALDEAFESIGVGHFTVRVSNRRVLAALLATHGIYNARAREIVYIIDEGGRQPVERTVAQLREVGVPDEVADDLGRLLGCSTVSAARELFRRRRAAMDGLDELAEVLQIASDLGMPASRLELDFSITRGHDYYTGTVYETFFAGYEHWGAIGSGGRYDNLLGHVVGSHYPGVGVSIGLTRLVGLLLEAGREAPDQRSEGLVVIAPRGAAGLSRMPVLIRAVRERRVRVQALFDPPPDTYGYAQRMGAVAVVEVDADSCVLRHMSGGPSRGVELNKVPEVLVGLCGPGAR